MKRHWMAVVVGVGVAMVAVAGDVTAQDTFEWNGRVGSGGVLKVKGITGSIRAEAASGATARVTAEKHGRAGDFGEVEIRMEQDGDDVVVCAVYRPDRGEGCDERGWNDDDRGSRRNRSIDVDVDFVVSLPEGTRFLGAMVTGDIDVRDVRSDVEASTVTGDVTVSTTGVARAHTVSGSVDVSMGSTDWRDLDFNTVSGDITLRFPSGLDTDVDFSSLSGDFESDFDVTLRGQARRQWVGARVRGTIGEGGRSLSVKTVSGDVRLVRGR